MENVNDCIFFAAADCTGHGVPGALVSVICSSALSKVVVEGRSVRFNIDYSESNKYSFSYGTELYYFYFKPQ